jgi:hypothetical protein
MRNIYIGDGGLDSSKRDMTNLVTSGNQPTRIAHTATAMRLLSPRPFSVSASICDEYALKCPRESSNAAHGLISCETDETVRLRKQVSFAAI